MKTAPGNGNIRRELKELSGEDRRQKTTVRKHAIDR